MTLGNDKKELKKGEKLMVTIEEALHNTLLVFLEYRTTKFCGILLNTSNRIGPYGLEEKPENAYYRAYDIDPKTLVDETKIEKPKKAKIPFPDPLSMRTTYDNKIPQPPVRQIYFRKRRSKRRVRMEMSSHRSNNLGNSGKKLLSHQSSCCCDTCAAGGLQELSKMERQTMKGKRKLISSENEKTIKQFQHRGSEDGVTPLEERIKRKKIENEEQDDGSKPAVQRSPVIKISYKSPGGKGRVLKIPSRVHNSPVSENAGQNDEKSRLQERAKRVVSRARYEHYKYLHEQKINSFILTDDGKPDKIPLKSTVTEKIALGLHPQVLLHPLKTEKPGSLNYIPPQKNDIVASAPSQTDFKSKPDTSQENLADGSTASSPLTTKKTMESASGIEKIPGKKVDTCSHSITVKRCKTQAGINLCQGDVVWGKIRGFPWWPGLIRKITIKRMNGRMEQEAVVDWFQSKTVSNLPCHTLECFSEHFSKRFDKKRRGNYKIAVMEAKQAEKNMSPEVRKLITQFET